MGYPHGLGHSPAGAYDAYLSEFFGAAEVRTQHETNAGEYCKEQRKEQRKSLTAARREALKDAKNNPPVNFRCVLYAEARPYSYGYRGGVVRTRNIPKRQADAFKDALKMGVSVEEEAPGDARAA